MCELLGLSFSEPTRADFALRQFGPRCDGNPHGWGLAWYPDRALAVAKEPVKWSESKLSNFLESYASLQSAIYISHVREKSSGGDPTFADTHPFAREWAGRDYCFAHNGTLADFATLALGRFRPVGQTDSEHAFCHVLEEIAKRASPLDGEVDWCWLHSKLQEVNSLGKMNCLFSDGRRLFAYRDQAGWKGLCYCERHDAEMDADKCGYAVASKPLNNNGWQEFHKGELAVVEGGRLRYSSHGQRA